MFEGIRKHSRGRKERLRRLKAVGESYLPVQVGKSWLRNGSPGKVRGLFQEKKT